MLSQEELERLRFDLENELVERTRAFDKVDKMGQAICAFANDLAGRGRPGYLLLGVENDGRLSGRRLDDDRLTSLGGMKSEGQLLPPPAMSMELFHYAEGDMLVIQVFPSAYPPIRYQGQVWIRVGARKALATDEDIHVLEERRLVTGRRFEELPCQGAQVSDLDLELFRNVYLPRAIEAEVVEDDPRPVERQLASLRFFDRVTGVPTHLGMLLFGRHPERFIPSAYIQYVQFAGQDNAADILAEHAYRGPLLKTIAELNAFVKVGIAAPHPVRISVLQEQMRYRFPEWAIRELLLNAIIHRDYQIGNAPVKFYAYGETRLEIANPGGLFGQVTQDNFPDASDYRNPLLAEALKVMGYVNKFNRGIAKVRAEMARNGNPEPVFEVSARTSFKVTVQAAERQRPLDNYPRPEQTGGMVGETRTPYGETDGETDGETRGRSGEMTREEAVLRTIARHPGIKRQELSQATRIPVRSVERILARLKAEHIEYRGCYRTGGWYLKKTVPSRR